MPATAAVQIQLPGIDQEEIVIPDNPPWFEDDLQEMAIAMQCQGTWFMGREVRTPEQAWQAAREIHILLYVMRYEAPYPDGARDGPLRPAGPPPIEGWTNFGRAIF